MPRRNRGKRKKGVSLVQGQVPGLWCLGEIVNSIPEPLQPGESHPSPDLGTLSPQATTQKAFFGRQHPRVATAGNYMQPQASSPLAPHAPAHHPSLETQLQKRGRFFLGLMKGGKSKTAWTGYWAWSQAPQVKPLLG